MVSSKNRHLTVGHIRNVQMPVFTWNIRKLYEVDVSRLAKQQRSHLASHIDVKKKGPDCKSRGQ